MWTKKATPEYLRSLALLPSAKRVAVTELVARLCADPRDDLHDPLIIDSNTREIEIMGLWLRYRVHQRERMIAFLRLEGF
jgi:hypothetical protein